MCEYICRYVCHTHTYIYTDCMAHYTCMCIIWYSHKVTASNAVSDFWGKPHTGISSVALMNTYTHQLIIAQKGGIERTIRAVQNHMEIDTLVDCPHPRHLLKCDQTHSYEWFDYLVFEWTPVHLSLPYLAEKYVERTYKQGETSMTAHSRAHANVCAHASFSHSLTRVHPFGNKKISVFATDPVIPTAFLTSVFGSWAFAILTHARAHAHMHTCTHTHTHTFTCACAYAQAAEVCRCLANLGRHPQVCACMRWCVCVCVCVYICHNHNTRFCLARLMCIHVWVCVRDSCVFFHVRMFVSFFSCFFLCM